MRWLRHILLPQQGILNFPRLCEQRDLPPKRVHSTRASPLRVLQATFARWEVAQAVLVDFSWLRSDDGLLSKRGMASGGPDYVSILRFRACIIIIYDS